MDSDRSRHKSGRRELEEDLGSSRSSGRRSGEVGHRKNAEHGGDANTNSGGGGGYSRRHAASPSSSASANYNNNGRRKGKESRGSSSSRSRSPSRSRSRSNSNSPSDRPPPPPPRPPPPPPSSSSLFDRLKADWGRESWQDFELLQNNVPGPGTKGHGGPGAVGGKCERITARGA